MYRTSMERGALRMVGLSSAVWLCACAHTVIMDSDPPGAHVTVDGQHVGLTPVPFEDSPGWAHRYQVRLEKDGYQPYDIEIIQESFNPAILGMAALCLPCTLGIGSAYLVLHSRQLRQDRYRYILQRAVPRTDEPVQKEAQMSPAGVNGTVPKTRPAGFRY